MAFSRVIPANSLADRYTKESFGAHQATFAMGNILPPTGGVGKMNTYNERTIGGFIR